MLIRLHESVITVDPFVNLPSNLAHTTKKVISFLFRAFIGFHNFRVSKGDKFLKKLWCYVGGEYYKIIWCYQLG